MGVFAIIFIVLSFIVGFGVGIYALFFIWQLALLVGISPIFALIFLWPIIIPLGPWYALFVWGAWAPLAIIYGGGFLAGLLRLIAYAVVGARPPDW